MTRFVMTLLAVALVAGCGNKGPLTPEQKAEFTTTLESAGRSHRTAESLNPGRERGALLSISERALDPDTEMKSKLQGRCDATPFEPEGLDSTTPDFSKPIKMGFEVKGGACPITFKFLTTTQMSQSGYSMGMDLTYEVKDESYKKLNDIYGMTMAGEISGSQSGGGGEFKGTLLSQKHGTIPTTISLSGSQNSGELTMTWEFPTYTAEMKAVASNGKVEYFDNGVSVSPAEWKKTLEKGGPAFTQVSMDNEAQGGDEMPTGFGLLLAR